MGVDKERIAYIDGLRSLAVGMVIVYHAWAIHARVHHTTATTAVQTIINQWDEGVSLFLVLSGFCLGLPALTRHARGDSAWFSPSRFFARRALRILPPYYVALALSVVTVIATHGGWERIVTDPRPLSIGNVLSHLLLLHNNTPDVGAINGPFWSLGLEWQWYWLFPVVVAGCLWSMRYTLAALLTIAVLWHVGLHDAGRWGGVMPVLPMRLFEFGCGVAVAALVARNCYVRPLVCTGGIVAPLLLIYAPYPTIHVTAHAFLIHRLLGGVKELGLTHPLYGIVWASLILLGASSGIARHILAWRPLVTLEVVSYSVYLVHGPLMEAAYGVLRSGHDSLMIAIPVLAAVSIGTGALFHLTIERPCMDRRAWQHVGPTLTRLFAWTDWLWAHGQYLAEPRIRPVPLPVVPHAAPDETAPPVVAR